MTEKHECPSAVGGWVQTESAGWSHIVINRTSEGDIRTYVNGALAQVDEPDWTTSCLGFGVAKELTADEIKEVYENERAAFEKSPPDEKRRTTPMTLAQARLGATPSPGRITRPRCRRELT